MAIRDIPQNNGGWFKPADHAEAVAILIEVKAYEAQRPTPNGPKDSALVDVTVFATQEAIDAGEPTTVQQGCRIEQTVLARDLAGLVGDETIVKLDQSKPTKPGAKPAWVYRQPDPKARAGVVAYYEAREAAIQAALADAPDFD